MKTPTSRLPRPAKPGASIRRDPGRITANEQAQAALELALYAISFDAINALAWVCAGCPDDGATQADRALYEAAKSIVRVNCGSIKPGDSELILSHVLKQHRLSRQGGEI